MSLKYLDRVIVLVAAMISVKHALAVEPQADPEKCCPPAAATNAPAVTQPVFRPLRITADPNNLPFTDKQCGGFENRIAALLASDLNVEPQYMWRAQRRGFFRHAIKEGEADLVLAVPVGFNMGLTTQPYYRSSYVFVHRDIPRLRGLRSLDDPRLRELRIGIQVVGDEEGNSPPAQALGARGIIHNLVGYSVLGDFRDDTPAARVMQGLARNEIHVAIVWGPVGGYFAGKLGESYVVEPVAEEVDPRTGQPMTFEICMAVSGNNTALRDRLNATLASRKSEIEAVLKEYHVPVLPLRSQSASAAEVTR